MSESRIQNAFSRTAILTVGRLLLFIVAGFAIGLVIGVVSEEPELLAGHARGETATVELDAALAARNDALAAAEVASALPDVAAPPAGYEAADSADDASGEVGADASLDRDAGHWSAGAPSASERSKAVGAGGEASAIAVPAASSGAAGAWAIQVGAFGDEPSARTLATRLESKGYPITVLPAGPDSNRWRVRVQPIGEEHAARGTALRIEREERLPTWVIRVEEQPRG